MRLGGSFIALKAHPWFDKFDWVYIKNYRILMLIFKKFYIYKIGSIIPLINVSSLYSTKK